MISHSLNSEYSPTGGSEPWYRWKIRAPANPTEAVVSHGVGMPRGSGPKITMTRTRSMAPMKMVRITVITTSRPTSGRNTSRSTEAASRPVTAMVARRATGQGRKPPSQTMTNAPTVTNSPWAKLNTCDAGW